MPVLTPDMVRSSGNTWSQVRTPALQQAAAAPFPTTDAEHWRYSRIDELSLADFAPAPTPTSVSGGSAPAVVTQVPASAASVDASLTDLFPVPADDLELFSALNLAHMDVVVVRVPRNAVVTDPIVVTHRLTGTGRAFFPRIVIDAAENSEVTVVECFVSPDDERLLVVPALDVRTAKSARVKYLGINQLGDAAWMIGEQFAAGHRDSDTLLATVALGGDYARVSTAARLVEQGGNTRQVALYFAGGTQMHDFRTLQQHSAPRTTSDLLFKGAVQDQAKSVYTGLIKIDANAKGSQAYQTNRNLTLSHGAWAESVPNLEIETNDVKCSHASTVGPIDEDQLFYLESRGVRPDIAQRLVVLGFFDEVIAQLPVGELAQSLRAEVSHKLSIGGVS
ncbi:MAG: hypothetical protein RL547_253 [Actinomycetota bacterium]